MLTPAVQIHVIPQPKIRIGLWHVRQEHFRFNLLDLHSAFSPYRSASACTSCRTRAISSGGSSTVAVVPQLSTQPVAQFRLSIPNRTMTEPSS